LPCEGCNRHPSPRGEPRPTLIEQQGDGTEGAGDSGKVTIETQGFGRNRQQPQIGGCAQSATHRPLVSLEKSIDDRSKRLTGLTRKKKLAGITPSARVMAFMYSHRQRDPDQVRMARCPDTAAVMARKFDKSHNANRPLSTSRDARLSNRREVVRIRTMNTDANQSYDTDLTAAYFRTATLQYRFRDKENCATTVIPIAIFCRSAWALRPDGASESHHWRTDPNPTAWAVADDFATTR